MDEPASAPDSTGPISRDPTKELQDIATTCRIVARAHYMSAEDYEHWNEFFGIATVVLTAGSGSAILGSSQAAETSTWLRLTLGVLTISAAIFAALQTFFGFAEKSKQHRTAGAAYAALRRQIDAVLACETATCEKLEEVNQQLAELANSSPTIRDTVWQRADREQRDEAGRLERMEADILRWGRRYRRRKVLAIIGPVLIIAIALLLEYGGLESGLRRIWSHWGSGAATTVEQPMPTSVADREPLAVEGTEPVSVPAAETPASPLPRGAAATAAWLEQAKARPPLLRAFLQAMPKGGDLHLHLSGAVYAEKLVGWAVEEGLCIDTGEYILQACPDPTPGRGDVLPIAEVVGNDIGFGRVVDAWSMRFHTPESGSGHDQFFNAFPKIGAVTSRRTADLLAAVAQDAAAQNVDYLEIMLTVDDPAPPRLAVTIAGGDNLQRSLEAAAGQLATANLAERVAQALASLDTQVADARQLAGCSDAEPYRICDVEVRFIQQVNRNRATADVFKAMLWAFALAAADGPVVGLNMVGPEDWRLARADYDLHMRMLSFIATLPGYDAVPIALHAGEQTLGLVPPPDLRSHLADAVRIGGARRLGHAVSLGFEEDALGLLEQLSDEQIAIEINLSSNDLILGVAGAAHPFQVYRDHAVPLVISTDDPGIARSDLTHEYQRAVESYDLGYADLKQLARNSLTFAFIQGESLWLDPQSTVPVEVCRGAGGEPGPGDACIAFLAANPKARLQWDLERRFTAFEATY
jgi:adenosine deaminase